ncbi:NYN domain-containing protein [Planomicrobium chinense]|uniref:NYN domain-containing protein n=1 Tax=Planococcus liqunii TaxID=3058394 RepID=A0ABT8MWM1_9BACL|nr:MULTISPECIES: NYN domain-containing protein [Planococcus]MBZ5202939.1 NYN domain-containing protein [Planococcus chinensis]MCP2036776.1 putative RNA-binding protein with PIN domain [Planomicrobium sp. HSC-17F08]MDN7229305.1 NYN domain-containing protein [Planococcus sp. N064]WKA51135.1 NYN domain-containing protein [Planococcus sp. N056]
MDILLVDGYNIIGDWSELKELKKEKLADARDRLVEQMAEYQSYKGWRVIIVFDAHLVPGIEAKNKRHDIEVIYTKESETADERIEKLATSLSNRRDQIHVATSDMTEQRVIFGKGALRISARELKIEMDEIQQNISKKVKEIQEQRAFSKISLSDEVTEVFEKWRRGQK